MTIQDYLRQQSMNKDIILNAKRAATNLGRKCSLTLDSKDANKKVVFISDL